MLVQRHLLRLKAFTLAEILVVLMILVIAAAVAIPNITGTNDIRAKSAAQTIAADLQYAQNMAITYQDPVTVTFYTAGESYTLSNASGPLIHPMTKSTYTVDFGSQDDFGNLDVVSASFSGAALVIFDELGAPNAAGSATVQVGSHVYRIDVAAATGNVTVVSVGS